MRREGETEDGGGGREMREGGRGGREGGGGGREGEGERDPRGGDEFDAENNPT